LLQGTYRRDRTSGEHFLGIIRFKKKEWAEKKEGEVRKYTPQKPSYEKKSFSSALDTFLAECCPSLRGDLIREPVVKEICKLVDTYYPPIDRVRMGQILWYAVDVKEKAGFGKRIEKCKLQPVILDLIHESDIDDILNGLAKKERQRKVAARLFKQAYDQGGVLTNADVGSIMRLSPGTVSKYIRDYEKEHKTMVPRRGNIHDMGRTLTHKLIICQKHLKEGKTIEQTAQETFHSPEAVRRYVNDFNRVRECLKAGWNVEKISYATGLSKNLTEEYVDMINDDLPF
jgi:predicted transcriptional regulator